MIYENDRTSFRCDEVGCVHSDHTCLMVPSSLLSLLLLLAAVSATPSPSRAQALNHSAVTMIAPQLGNAQEGRAWRSSDTAATALERLSNNSTDDQGVLEGVVGFWHVGPATRYNHSVVHRQLEDMRHFPFLQRVKINYLDHGDVIPPRTRKALQQEGNMAPTPLPTELAPYDRQNLWEFPTILSLWKHCHRSPSDIVFYVHTKSRRIERRWYMAGMFRQPQQVFQAFKANSSTWLWSASDCNQFFYCHPEGNFWWARCEHIVQLNNPFDPTYLNEKGNWHDVPPTGRYRAEAWVLGAWLGARPQPLSELIGSKSRRALEREVLQRSPCWYPAVGGNVCDLHVVSGISVGSSCAKRGVGRTKPCRHHHLAEIKRRMRGENWWMDPKMKQ